MSDESLFREVDEEVRQEQYKKLWDRYGNYFIALCLAVVASVAGAKGYQYYQKTQSEAAAVVYFDGMKKAAEGKPDDALKALAGVDHPGFRQLARMQEAIVLSEQGKTKEAVAAFDAVDDELRGLAADLNARDAQPNYLSAFRKNSRWFRSIFRRHPAGWGRRPMI